jgi:hypothetical protein
LSQPCRLCRVSMCYGRGLLEWAPPLVLPEKSGTCECFGALVRARPCRCLPTWVHTPWGRCQRRPCEGAPAHGGTRRDGSAGPTRAEIAPPGTGFGSRLSRRSDGGPRPLRDHARRLLNMLWLRAALPRDPAERTISRPARLMSSSSPGSRDCAARRRPCSRSPRMSEISTSVTASRDRRRTRSGMAPAARTPRALDLRDSSERGRA